MVWSISQHRPRSPPAPTPPPRQHPGRQSKLTNYFYPQQKPISKVRDGAKVAKKHDTAAPPRKPNLWMNSRLWITP
jgi:hypothetical protein